MPIDLYYNSLSPPCRSVMMTAYMAGVDVNLKLLNLMNGDQLKPEFLKINPQHNVPTIVDDDGFCLNESQAICAYLINRHGGQKGQHLYPEDAQQRAVIDQLLNFDSSVLFANTRELYVRNNNRVCDMRARLVTSYKNQSITSSPPLLYPKWELQITLMS